MNEEVMQVHIVSFLEQALEILSSIPWEVREYRSNVRNRVLIKRKIRRLLGSSSINVSDELIQFAKRISEVVKNSPLPDGCKEEFNKEAQKILKCVNN